MASWQHHHQQGEGQEGRRRRQHVPSVQMGNQSQGQLRSGRSKPLEKWPSNKPRYEQLNTVAKMCGNKIDFQVDEVIGIMHKNVENVLERDRKLGDLEERADALQDGCAQFEKQVIQCSVIWEHHVFS